MKMHNVGKWQLNDWAEFLYELRWLIMPLIAIITFVGFMIYYTYGTNRQIIVNVDSVERVVARDGQSSKYMVFTDRGVFENVDSILWLKFNSSDVYANLLHTSGIRCLHVYGWRISLVSQYPNIIDVCD